MFDTKHDLDIEDIVDEDPFDFEDEEPENDSLRMGKVIGVARLNIRSEPKASAEVVCEIADKVELMIDLDKSTNTFYKVITSAGVEGYCVKRHIALDD